MKRIAQGPGRLDLAGAPEGFDALVMADIARARGGISVFVARDGARASAFVDALRFFAPEVEVITFPSWDCLPYDRMGPSGGVAAQRMATLARLTKPEPDNKPRILVTQAPALLQRVPPRAAIRAAHYEARVGRVVNIADLERYFAVNGYQRASTVSERGEFAIRGGVIDVFPPGAEEPVRLDLFGDTLESIRGFDPATQRSTRQLTAVDLPPVSEVLLDPAAIARFRTGYVAAFGASADDPLYATVSEGGRRSGLEHFLPLLYDELETLFDYLGDDVLFGIDHLAGEARDERLAMIADAFDARQERTPRFAPATTPGRRTPSLGPPRNGTSGWRAGRRAGSRRSTSTTPTPSSTWARAWAAPLSPSGRRTASTCSRPLQPTRSIFPPRANACCSPPGPRARPSAWGPCWPTMA